MDIFTIEKIRETATHKELISKNENFKVNLLESRIARGRITNAFKVWKNTGTIPTTVRNIELAIVNDFINMQQHDRSGELTADEINLCDV